MFEESPTFGQYAMARRVMSVSRRKQTNLLRFAASLFALGPKLPACFPMQAFGIGLIGA